jgi:hypothetical protein
MKKVLILALLLCAFLGGVFAENAEDKSPALDNGIGFDMAEQLLTSLTGMGLISLPLDYQHSFNGNLGLSVGINPVFWLLAIMDGEAVTDYLDLVIAVGPSYYLSADGIGGLYGKARAIVEIVGPGFLSELSAAGVDANALNFGAELHVGYNLLFGPFEHAKSFLSPEIGFRFMPYSGLSVNWGVLFGSAF